MADPTDPTPAPTPAPEQLVVERGPQAQATEEQKAEALDKGASAHERVAMALEAASQATAKEVYLSVLLRCVELPFMYDEKYGRLDTNRADDVARDVVKLWQSYS